MDVDITVAVIGLVGGLVGGLVSAAGAFFATSRHELWKYKNETRTDAYRALMDATANLGTYVGALQQSGVTTLSPVQQRTLLQLRTALAGAHSKMALYASPLVMEKAGAFFSRHAMMATNEDIEAFIDMVEAMRSDSFADNYSAFRNHVDQLWLRQSMKAAPSSLT